MANYYPIYKCLWNSQRFSRLDKIQKLVFLYLLNNDRTTQTGIYNILPRHIASDCDLEKDEALKMLIHFDEIKLIRYWQDEDLIYIHKFFGFARKTIKNAKILNGVIQRQRELIKNKELWLLFDAEFQDELYLIDVAINKGIDKTLIEPLI